MPKKTKKPRSYIQEFLDLSDAEKEKVWLEFEDPGSADTFRPLNASERKLWAKAKRKVGRPVVGAGSKVISVSVERELLGRADALAKDKGITRAALVAAGLKVILKKPTLLKDRSAA